MREETHRWFEDWTKKLVEDFFIPSGSQELLNDEIEEIKVEAQYDINDAITSK